MKQFIVFVKKEFAHVLRDRKTLLIFLVCLSMQILIFGFALTNEVKNSKIIIVDHAKDMLRNKSFLKLKPANILKYERSVIDTEAKLKRLLKKGRSKLAVLFPVNFNDDLLHQNKAKCR